MEQKFDKRFSDPEAEPTPWDETFATLEKAELYWITTVRKDGRPHVVPLIGVGADDTVYFCTGLEEQKARNLEHNDCIAITTGNNEWASGLDVVVEGRAVQISDDGELQRLADAWEAKYGEVWHFDVADGMFRHADGAGVAVFRVEPAKVLAFAKDPHGQTTFRF
jgi:nitroimidazol reductase NimA-like FMN-containing flavoprotein (pyridoxamine 5'-phosphate oxidase superfamily)